MYIPSRIIFIHCSSDADIYEIVKSVNKYAVTETKSCNNSSRNWLINYTPLRQYIHAMEE